MYLIHLIYATKCNSLTESSVSDVLLCPGLEVWMSITLTCNGMRMWSSSWEDDLWGFNERQRMTGHVMSYNYEPCLRLIFESSVSRLEAGAFTLQFFIFSCATQILNLQWGFECQRGNPAWRLFWYCWKLSWKTFLLSYQGCSGFRAIGSSAETPHLITA